MFVSISLVCLVPTEEPLESVIDGCESLGRCWESNPGQPELHNEALSDGDKRWGRREKARESRAGD